MSRSVLVTMVDTNEKNETDIARKINEIIDEIETGDEEEFSKPATVVSVSIEPTLLTVWGDYQTRVTLLIADKEEK